MSLERLIELDGEMKKCFRCSLCKMVPLPTVLDRKYSDGCPANRVYNFHGFSGSGKNIMALALVEGRIKADQDLADITQACTTCGLCDVSCKFIMEAERHLVNMALREHLVEEGLDNPAHRKIVENLKTWGHPDGKSADSMPGWADGLDLKILPHDRADVLLFAGCSALKDPASASIARKLAVLLTKAGVDFGILSGEEPCCGLPAYWTGYRDVFTEKAKNVTKLVNSLGVNKVVVTSGSCFGAMRSKYPEYADAPQAKIVHATEILERLINDRWLRLTKPVIGRVTYHDSCYLGRQSEPPLKWEGEIKTTHGCMKYANPPKEINRGINGIYDEPRRILNSIKGLEFVEMHRIREYSFCCGGGGGVPEAYPELAKSAAAHRMEEAEDVGADFLVTSCHHCRDNLSNKGNGHLPVIDVIDLVYKAVGMEDGTA